MLSYCNLPRIPTGAGLSAETVLTPAEILIFGTGERVLPAPKAIRDYISGLGIQLDVMDSVSEVD